MILLIHLTTTCLSQSWSVALDPVRDHFDIFSISEPYNDEILLQGFRHLIRMNEEGEVLGIHKFQNPVPRAKVLRDRVYRFERISAGLLVRAYDGNAILEDSIIIELEGDIYDVDLLSLDTIYVIRREDREFTYLEKYARSGSLMASKLIGSTLDPPSVLEVSDMGNIYCLSAGSGEMNWSFSLELDENWSIANDSIGMRISVVEEDSEGNIFVAGTPQADTILLVKMNSSGEVINKVKTKVQLDPEENGWSGVADLEINGNIIACKASNFRTELASNVAINCYDLNLNHFNAVHIDNGGFHPAQGSSLTINNSGGFVFPFGQKIDPTDEAYRSLKRLVVYSIDSTCVLTPSKHISGTVFNDENQNELKDSLEYGLSNIKVLHLPDSIISLTDSLGNFNFIVSQTGSNTVEIVDSNSCFHPNLRKIEFDFSESDTIGEALFPVVKTSELMDIDLNIQSGLTRCGFMVPFWYTVTNSGCSELSGTVTARFSELVSHTQFEESLTWDISELQPTQSSQMEIFFRVANEDFEGDTIKFTLEFEGSGIHDSVAYMQVIRCAVDPNDKLVTPNRQEENYTLFRESLEYTIRFQNVGTDTAFNIIIEDTLSQYLDPSTFNLISSSHVCKTELRNQVITFYFDDILLVDSSTNESHSHGYVRFSIRSFSDTPENSLVGNQAAIYFDFNRPIFTNMVYSTMVEEIDRDQDSYFFWEDCNDYDSTVQFSSPEIPNNGVDEDCDGEDLITTNILDFHPNKPILYPNPAGSYLMIDLNSQELISDIHLFDSLGRTVKIGNPTVRGDTIKIDISHLVEGTYFIKVLSDNIIFNAAFIKL